MLIAVAPYSLTSPALAPPPHGAEQHSVRPQLVARTASAMSATMGVDSQVSAQPAEATRWVAIDSSGRSMLAAAPQHREAAQRLLAVGAPAASRADDAPSLANRWYVLALSSQLGADQLLATRLWGEPLVLYRDSKGAPVCVRDVCPHRSAPLSMGDVEGGKLRCFYHGWAFGEEGRCTDVPTIARGGDKRRGPIGAACANLAVEEHEGMLWVWSGDLLAADARKLPRHPVEEGADGWLVVDTVLDYDCEWSAVAEAKLGARSVGLTPLADVARGGSLFRFGEAGPKTDLAAVARFDAPNVIRVCRASGFSEEYHVAPIGPQRTRVILRQRLPRNPLLAAVSAVGGASVLTLLVQQWNYNHALEEYGSFRGGGEGGAASSSAGAAEEARVGFRAWLEQATAERGGQPYFVRWGGDGAEDYGPQTDDEVVGALGEPLGTYGLKKNYVQGAPVAEHAPSNAAPHAQFRGALKAGAAAALAAVLSVPFIIAS